MVAIDRRPEYSANAVSALSDVLIPPPEFFTLPRSEMELRQWGNMKLITYGLGKERDNNYLAGVVGGGLTAEQIYKSTGFEKRHQLQGIYGLDISPEDASHLVTQGTIEMGRLMLDVQGWRPPEVDIVVTLSSNPENDYIEFVSSELGLVNASTVEVSSSCPSPALALLRLGQIQNRFPEGAKVLVVGVEILTPSVLPPDLVLFSDQAMAWAFTLGGGQNIEILSPYLPGVTVKEYPSEAEALRIGPTQYDISPDMETQGEVLYYKKTVDREGNIHMVTRSDYPPAASEANPQVRLLMDGDAVTRWMLAENPNLQLGTIDVSRIPDNFKNQTLILVTPHQANLKLLEKLERRSNALIRRPDSGYSKDTQFYVYRSCRDLGNCAALTTPIAFMRALEGVDLPEEATVQSGGIVVVPAFGAGLVGAATLVRVNKV